MDQNFKDIKKNLVQVLAKLDQKKLDEDVSYLKAAKIKLNQMILPYLASLDDAQERFIKHQISKLVAFYSGGLAFLLFQNFASLRLLSHDAYNDKQQLKKEAYSCGIAIAHLRRETPCAFAKDLGDGHIELNGLLPWASGFRIYDYVIIGFHYQNQEALALVPFKESQSFVISKPIETFVANAVNTVSVQLNQYVIDKNALIKQEALGFFREVSKNSINMLSLLTGINERAIDLLNKKEPEIANQFSKKLNKIEGILLSNENIVDTRLDLLHLSQVIISFLAATTGGKSALIENPIQRLYRESLLFSLSGISVDIVDIFRERLLNQ